MEKDEKSEVNTIHRGAMVARIAAATGFIKDDVRSVLSAYSEEVEKELMELNEVIISENVRIKINKFKGRRVTLVNLDGEKKIIDIDFYLSGKLSITKGFKKKVKLHNRIGFSEVDRIDGNKE